MMNCGQRSADASSALRPSVKQCGRGARAPIIGWLAFIMSLASLLVLTSGCRTSQNLGESSAADLTTLRAAPEDWDHAFGSNDAAKMAAFYAEDAISMPENAPTLRGRHAIQANYERYFAQYTARHETFVDEILTHQDWAIERGRFTVTSTPKPSGPQSKQNGRYVVCRRKINGSWLIAWEIWNTDSAGER